VTMPSMRRPADNGLTCTGGRIRVVEINIGDDGYVDRERDFHAAMARD
jgi:hypothetical protein